MFESSKRLLEITFILRGYHIYEDIWEVEISSKLPFYLCQIIMKIVKPQPSFDCFKAASTASLVVAEGSASENGPSGL